MIRPLLGKVKDTREDNTFSSLYDRSECSIKMVFSFNAYFILSRRFSALTFSLSFTLNFYLHCIIS